MNPSFILLLNWYVYYWSNTTHIYPRIYQLADNELTSFSFTMPATPARLKSWLYSMVSIFVFVLSLKNTCTI